MIKNNKNKKFNLYLFYIAKLNIKLCPKRLSIENHILNLMNDDFRKLKNQPSIEEIISVTLNCTLIRMTEINRIDRSALYQEFKEWIINSGDHERNQEILCLRYLKNDRKIN